MRIIDELTADLAASSRRTSTGAPVFDPILHITEGNVWTLGMTVSIWRYIFRRDAEDVCQRGIPF
jgi:hypothetical protein